MDTRRPLRRKLTELVERLAALFGAQKPAISEYRLPIEDLPEPLAGLKLVQLSDLHARRFGAEQRFLREAVASLEPDAILLTGDFVEAADEAELNALEALLRELCALAPVYFAPGNHEARLSGERIGRLESMMKACGVEYLAGATVPFGGGEAVIGGLRSKPGSALTADTRMDETELLSLASVTEEARGRFLILLSHRPELYEAYRGSGARLVFSGHAHGGLMPLGRRALLAPGQGWFPERVRGVFREGAMTQVISVGLGGPRIFVKSEIVSVVLYKSYPQPENPLK